MGRARRAVDPVGRHRCPSGAGPTQVVVEEQPGIFERISIAFPLPGEDAAASLGPPDVLFFALFLATAARFELRVGATWLAMTGAVSR